MIAFARHFRGEPLEPEPVTGSYFVAAYPPFSCWTPSQIPAADAALGEFRPGEPLGLYIHLPFCQRKCNYCYCVSYTGKSTDQIDDYLARVLEELRQYAHHPLLESRPLEFVYFGGGTPSLLEPDQMLRFARGLQRIIAWNGIREVTYECAPSSLDSAKLAALESMGVSRLSMEVQSFDDEILERNGRTHLASDVEKAYSLIQAAEFDCVNLDLMVGLIGETRESFETSIRRAIELDPDSITVYQTEIPHNTHLHRELERKALRGEPIEWNVKRERLAWAFRTLEKAGYTIVSGYAAVKNPQRRKFIYQEHLWRGGDMLGLGVASFSYAAGVHFQNEQQLSDYCAQIDHGELPIQRAHGLDPTEQLLREFILQLKWGRVDVIPFKEKFGEDILSRFEEILHQMEMEGWLTISDSEVLLTRAGLLRVDRLLPRFYQADHHGIRCT